jgi:preprotein translocase subunit YajC
MRFFPDFGTESSVNPIDLLPALAIFGIFFVLVILPQMREKREHDDLVASLAKGDRVVTSSGVHGTVSSVGPDTIALEVAEGTSITVDKATVARRLPAAPKT